MDIRDCSVGIYSVFGAVMPKKGRSQMSPERKAEIRTLVVDQGMTYREVAKLKHVSSPTITKIMKEYEDHRPLVEAYKKNRADIETHDQIRYRSHITEEKLEKASADVLERMRDKSYMRERLERGESTQNVQTLKIVAALDDLQKRRHEGKA